MNLQITPKYSYVPKWITDNAVIVYALALIVTYLLFFRRAMPIIFLIIGVLMVICTFFLLNLLSKKWRLLSDRMFEKKLLNYSIVFRIAYVIISYFFYKLMTGEPFEFGAGDSITYHNAAGYLVDLYNDFQFNLEEDLRIVMSTSISDWGYPFVLSVPYWLTQRSILISRILKAVVSGYTVLLLYRLAKYEFGEQVARLAGIMVMLMPMLIYYTGLGLKETFMTFLFVWYVERADILLRQPKSTIWSFIPVTLLAISLFFFRTTLAIVAILALFFALLMSSSKVIGWGRKIIIGCMGGIMMLVVFDSRFGEEVGSVFQTDVKTQQETHITWRSSSKNVHGNSFAKYASASVFAPLIFTIPFPTMVEVWEQEDLEMQNGAYFVKNVLSGFTILALALLLLSGSWREHLLPLSAMLGYLLVLVFSPFAQSGRFHIPIIPLEMMFAAYGISICGKRQRRWYNIWLAFIFVTVVFWQWFKLRGRGL